LITRDSIRDVWGERSPYAGEGEWPVRVDERTIEAPERWVQSCCALCSNGCALDVGVRDGRIVGVRGRAVDHTNRGRLGPKGLHAFDANHSADRLTKPLLRRDGRLEPVSWDDAMTVLAHRMRGLLASHGPGALGIYTTGQLTLEEHYTLATIAQAGLRTSHLDANTRLCTASAAAALMESFGAEGAPGTWEDYDTTDAAFLVGHNLAETNTVLWSRLLDRRRGPKRPALVVVDPRTTPTAAEADVHLRPRLGTNVALLNGILHLLIKDGHVDEDFVRAHTTGFEALRRTVAPYTPARVEELTQVPAPLLSRATDVLGTAPSLVSSCLSGVHQSHQATAAAVQVNNIHLLRGLIGVPGSTVFQLGGQASGASARETGASGELAAFLNRENPRHLHHLAKHWNVRPQDLPHHAPPTHILQMLRFAEDGSLRFLWVVGTNPAVSLPELSRVRRVIDEGSLFVVVQDAFLTETAALADLVLPSALWGEKVGTFTNGDRTVHIGQKAVDPPGEARSDLEIFLDLAEHMDFRDKDRAPLVKWDDAESAFDHFKELTRGRPCDYSGLSHARLADGAGIQWPCDAARADGTARLYTDRRFSTGADECQTWGHDLVTGAAITADEYRARDPRGRAHLKGAPYVPPPEAPDGSYPFWLTTGRAPHRRRADAGVSWELNTRTKTGRSPELAQAAPDVEIEMCAADARKLGVREGEPVIVESRRGGVRARVRIADILAGHLFLSFHYGSWDAPDAPPRAGNELTLTSWDPVSKQPLLKLAAARVRRA
jgi:ferredoxin-nitrate reductase